MALWRESSADDHELISYVLAGEDAASRAQTTKGEVRAIIRGRMLRLFGHIAGRIERSGVARLCHAAHGADRRGKPAGWVG